jgi:hypothetical protein
MLDFYRINVVIAQTDSDRILQHRLGRNGSLPIQDTP